MRGRACSSGGAPTRRDSIALELLPLIARVHAQVPDLQEEIAVHRLTGTFELLHETREPAFVIA